MRSAWHIILIGLGGFVVGTLAHAQQAPDFEPQSPNGQKIPIELTAAGIRSKEINIFAKGDQIYVPMTETFKFIGIKADYDSVKQRVTGFFKSSDSTYIIDLRQLTGEFNKNKALLTPADALTDSGHLYLRLGFLNDFFRIELAYNPRRLLVNVKNARDLPAVVEARRHLYFERGSRRRTFPEPDQFLGRESALFKGGRFDWNLTSRFSKSAYLGSRYNFALGAKALGVDLTATSSGFGQPGRHSNRFRANARLPVFDNPTVRQIVAGDFINSGIVSREITGIEITNRPAALRHFFTREVFRGAFDPNIDVGLSGSIEGLQLQQTDAHGNYQFDAPVLYGNGLLELHAFDQWGQERVLQYRETVPRTLIPPGEVEYSVSAGTLRPPTDITASSSSINWGISPNLTIGAKIDYYDFASISRKLYAGLSSTARFTSNMIFSALIVPYAFSRTSLDWQLPSTAVVQLSNIRYSRSQYFNPANVKNDFLTSLSVPVPFRIHRFVVDASFSNRQFEASHVDEYQIAVSDVFSIVTTRFSTSVTRQITDADGTTIQQHNSNGSLAVFLPAGVVFRTEVQYNNLFHRVEAVSAEVVKRFVNSFGLAVQYSRIPSISVYSLGVQLDYFFPFAHALSGTTTSGAGRYEYVMSGSGSMSFDALNTLFMFRNRPNFVGFGGFMVRPFLDANGNGQFDNGEEQLSKASLYYSNATLGSQPILVVANKLGADRIISYEEYDVFLDPQSLDNPFWVPEFTGIRMLSEPNYMRLVNIPVVTGGIVRGSVKVTREGRDRPVEGLSVALTALSETDAAKKKFLKTTTTFSTGEFEFSAIPPGLYMVQLVATQLATLGLKSNPAAREVEIVARAEGDIKENIDFQLAGR